MTVLDADLYRRLLERSPEGVVLVDAVADDQPVLYVNPAFEVLCGYTANELVGRNLRLLQTHDREQEGRHRLRESLVKGESTRVLLRNYRKDGSLFWNEMTVIPLRDGAGKITHFVGYHRDAGERLRMDSRLPRDTLSGSHQPTAVAIRDDRLTGLYTRPYLEELLRRDWAIGQREGRSIALFMVDVDALELYNTTFGRVAGDSAIRRVAHCISGCLRRSSDVTARIDGGSFMAFAPGLDTEHALKFANTMAERVRELRIHHPRSTILRYITITVGVAAMVPTRETGPNLLLEQAQARLEAAKKAGRNCAA